VEARAAGCRGGNEYYDVGAINRVGVEPLGADDFYGQSYFVNRAASSSAMWPRTRTKSRGPRPGSRPADRGPPLWQFYRDRRPDSYESFGHAVNAHVESPAGPWCPRAGAALAMCWLTARRFRRWPRPVAMWVPPGRPTRVIDATDRTCCPVAIDAHTHMEMPSAAPSLRRFPIGHPGGGVGRHDHDHRFRRQKRGNRCARRSTLARQGPRAGARSTTAST